SLFCGVLAASISDAAAEPQTVATYKDWSVFVHDTGADRICFAAAEAADKSPKTVNHGDIFFLIATWKSGAASNQPSFRVGYNLQQAPAPTIRIGSDKLDMYSSENEAFIESAASEQSLIAAMRKGADMKISAMSSRGTATSYVVSLSGVSAALDRVREACR
ncbi:MAG TPA: invasion associated locus B family protein, partial [Parvularculaceae bacterium]|nr:invasion associated locus B family protein [Parvularculaceae bacterium]